MLTIDAIAARLVETSTNRFRVTKIVGFNAEAFVRRLGTERLIESLMRDPLGFVVAGSIVTEQLFACPGIGSKLLQAVQNDDHALMQAIFLVITVAVRAANLVVDLLYGLIDPAPGPA